MINDALGDRMKAYEAVSRTGLMPHSYHVLRVDGRAFHSYLRDARKPFDENFTRDMMSVGVALCSEVSGTVLAYGQSDEISVIFQDLLSQSQPWFGGRVQKIVSVAASIATVALIRARGVNKDPQFDARVFTLPNVTEVANYLIWRQRDAIRNSISMAAQAKFSHSQLQGMSSNQMQEMLYQQHGINWNDYPEEQRRGWVVLKGARFDEVSFTHKRTGEEQFIEAVRTYWDPLEAPNFTVDNVPVIVYQSMNPEPVDA